MGTGSENALVVVGIRRNSAGVQVGRRITQVPGSLQNSKFLRRLVLVLVFLNFLKIM